MLVLRFVGWATAHTAILLDLLFWTAFTKINVTLKQHR